MIIGYLAQFILLLAWGSEPVYDDRTTERWAQGFKARDGKPSGSRLRVSFPADSADAADSRGLLKSRVNPLNPSDPRGNP
jgi:hypothetical protein